MLADNSMGMMMRRTSADCVLLLVLIGTAVLLGGCEREHRSYAGAKAPLLGSPEYRTSANITTMPGGATIESIAPAPQEAAEIDAAALYAKSCGACHQPGGQGVPAVFPPLDDSPYVVGDNVERLAAIMLYGLMGPIEVQGTTYSSAMAGLGAQFSNEELAAVATYIRSSWSNSAGPVEPEIFAKVREKYGSRGPFTIQELGAEQ